jgi:hypothetical protein
MIYFLCWQYSFVTPVTSLVVVKPNDTHAIGSEVNQPEGKIHLFISVWFSIICRYHRFEYYTTTIHNLWDWCCHLYSSCSSTVQWQMIGLAHLGSQCTTFPSAGRTYWSLELCIWSDVISWWIRQRNSWCASHCATFLSRVITGDESSIYGYEPETKQQSCQ